MMSLVLDDHQVCRGLIAMNLQTLELKAFPADAVIMATGGPGLIFGKSTNSMVCTGSAVAACYQQGAKYANGEFIQVHPDLDSRRRQAAADVGIRARRRRTRLGAAQTRRHATAVVDSGKRALVFPRREVSGLRQSGAARHRHARNFPGLH